MICINGQVPLQSPRFQARQSLKMTVPIPWLRNRLLYFGETMMKKVVIATGLTALAVAMQVQAAQKTPSMEEMWQLIQAQQAEISKLKEAAAKRDEQLQVTLVKFEETEKKVEATADVVEQHSEAGVMKLAEWVNNTQLGGYGEHHFNNFKHKDDEVDAHRFVLYLNHQFSDTVRLFTELEVEHGVAGEGKDGEVELEQAFIEWDFTENHRLHIGQFLVPVGILNETHEPDTFYGVERNNVEKNIIPTTWWETGVQIVGEIAPGLSYNAGVHSGLEVLADTTNENYADKGYLIRGGRQKSSEANAEDLAATARLKYTGIAGLELSATYQHQQDVTQGQENSVGASADLIEAHVIYQSGDFGLRALYAMWDIDGADAKALGRDEQEGWYIEPSYKLTERLGIFARYSEWDNEAGLSNDTEVEQWDYGIAFWLTPRVVLKADITDTVNKADDAFNLGVGWSF
jgi:hypothetical protein